MGERVKASAILVNKGGVTTLGGEVEMEEPCQAWRGKGWTFEGWREIRRHKRRCGARVFRKFEKNVLTNFICKRVYQPYFILLFYT